LDPDARESKPETRIFYSFTGFLFELTRRFSTAAKHIELVVGAQAGEVGQTVRHTKKGRDCRYVPNLIIAERKRIPRTYATTGVSVLTNRKMARGVRLPAYGES
jgi:hypothetical protein